ncbi:MAG: type Z 30S ribosomal protein S14 [Terriglobales bacterium]
MATTARIAKELKRKPKPCPDCAGAGSLNDKPCLKCKGGGRIFRTRKRNRCNLCGRPRAYLRKFGLCRLCFRGLALKGEIPGVSKSSW